MLFSLAACGNEEDIEAGVENEVEAEGGKTVVRKYGTNHYEEFEATVYLPEGAYFDEDTYEIYEEDGYVYTVWIYDDEKEYSVSSVDYWSKASFNPDPIGYDVPQQLYFEGELDEETAEEYIDYNQTVTPLGFEWEDKEVILVETTYADVDGFEYSDVFVGVEYEVLFWDIDENGVTHENLTAPALVGFTVHYSGWDELTEDHYAWLAGELLGVDSGRSWTVAEE